MKKNLFITQGALIGGLYVVLTMVSQSLGLASGAIQLRFSEALTILPCFTPAAIPGLFVGCIVSNLLAGSLPADVVFGSIATLIGAIGTRKLRNNKYLAVLPPIISNTVIIPFVLKFAYAIPGSAWYFALTVFAGEFISAGIFGYLLLTALNKRLPRT